MRDTQSADPIRLRGQEISNDDGILKPGITPSPRVSGRAWAIVGMMFLFMVINFADKAVLGLAAIPIMRDLNLTNEQFGQAGSALFLLFSISAILVGFIANRVSTKLLIVVMALTRFRAACGRGSWTASSVSHARHLARWAPAGGSPAPVI